MSETIYVLLSVFALCGAWYAWRWFVIARNRRRAVPSAPDRVRPADTLIGFFTNFFDTLGIGSFAPTTALFKVFRRVRDEDIPGTLNAGHTLPTIAQALIFIAVVEVDPVTLTSMILAAALGAWIGVGIVVRLPVHAIQFGMGMALIVAGFIFMASNLQWMPVGGSALQLQGWALALAIVANFALGALMMLGIGLYAPCLMLVSLLGMNPLAAFPIMMGSCALLMPIGAVRFVGSGRYNHAVALGLVLGGIPAVLIAAFVVKSLPMHWLRWLVIVVVLYAAAQMLLSARRKQVLQANS